MENLYKITGRKGIDDLKSLYAFGSVLSDKFNDESDIDLIVNFSDVQLLDYADNYFDLK